MAEAARLRTELLITPSWAASVQGKAGEEGAHTAVLRKGFRKLDPELELHSAHYLSACLFVCALEINSCTLIGRQRDAVESKPSPF